MRSESAKALLQVMHENTASNVLEDRTRRQQDDDEIPKDVVELDSTMTTLHAAEILWKHNILSAPVWDVDKEEYVGFFDMRDILSAVVASTMNATTEQDLDDDEGSLLEKYNISMVKELANLDASEGGTESVTITYLAKRHPIHARCQKDTPLIELCKLLAKKGCHRLPLYQDGSSRIANILSQSAVVQFLTTHANPDMLLSETIGATSLEYKKEVIAVKDTAPAWEAFGTLDCNGLSGIAVVDEETGALVGNTSARDIRLAASTGGSICMTMDILSYLAELRICTATAKDRHPTCSVRETDTISHLLHLLSKTGYHRVFVVDEEKKPIGVISVADIIRFALNEEGK